MFFKMAISELDWKQLWLSSNSTMPICIKIFLKLKLRNKGLYLKKEKVLTKFWKTSQSKWPLAKSPSTKLVSGLPPTHNPNNNPTI